MRLFNRNIITGQLQAVIWAIVSILDFLSNLQYGRPARALSFTILEMLFYAFIILGNTYWLLPRFYYRGRIVMYSLLVLLLLASDILLGGLGTVYLDIVYSISKRAVLTPRIWVYHTFSAVLIFIFSILYRLALDYIALSKKQGEIAAEKVQTELRLLKQQVHPHFLFNTLNNIYYVAQKGSPEAAELIERLSNIMRYFVEESNKEKVFLKDELELLKSYIELESIRLRYDMPLEFKVTGGIGYQMVPPLLLLPIVENIFKHGVDKRSKENFAEINLTLENGKLSFYTRNRHYPVESPAPGGKTGLVNLEKRLMLYYANNYKLDTQKVGDLFIANLEITFYEN
jgi:LytS/YehU family sensor histidine kinase